MVGQRIEVKKVVRGKEKNLSLLNIWKGYLEREMIRTDLHLLLGKIIDSKVKNGVE